MSDVKILVCGAGGFIGGHLVADLLRKGFQNIRAVDSKPIPQWHSSHREVDNRVLDLTRSDACHDAVRGCSEVYNLAADMGGMGFIELNKTLCMINVLINTHLLQAAKELGVERYFFSSSACVYNAQKQKGYRAVALAEEDAYPAMPEDGYGWEKLFSERMCRHFREDFNLTTRVARYHNVYGERGTYEGGREKAPAAICRKIAEAKIRGSREIEIWGTGEQTRSFQYIDDCVYGTQLIMNGEYSAPLNLGSSELVSINELVSIVEDIAGITLVRRYKLEAPLGVNGRNSDNTLIKSVYGWEPSTGLRAGLEKTYQWIYDQIALREKLGPKSY